LIQWRFSLFFPFCCLFIYQKKLTDSEYLVTQNWSQISSGFGWLGLGCNGDFFTLIKVAALTNRRPKVKAHEKSEPKQQLGPSCCVTETNLAESPVLTRQEDTPPKKKDKQIGRI